MKQGETSIRPGSGYYPAITVNGWSNNTLRILIQDEEGQGKQIFLDKQNAREAAATILAYLED